MCAKKKMTTSVMLKGKQLESKPEICKKNLACYYKKPIIVFMAMTNKMQQVMLLK